MSEVLTYLQQRYEATLSPFTSYVAIQNVYGSIVAKNALNELYKEGRIIKHIGINEPIIEYIIKK